MRFPSVEGVVRWFLGRGEGMRVHHQEELRGARTSVQAMGSHALSLDFKVDRIENQIDLGYQEAPCARGHEGYQDGPCRQQGSHYLAHIPDCILTVDLVLVR